MLLYQLDTSSANKMSGGHPSGFPFSSLGIDASSREALVLTWLAVLIGGVLFVALLAGPALPWGEDEEDEDVNMEESEGEAFDCETCGRQHS